VPHKPDYLTLSDKELLAQCEVDRFRASGPGGQKRNKTESAVRLRHPATGLSATGTESRSQHENRARALRRLRERIAMEFRRPVDPDGYEPPAEVRALFGAGARPSRRNPELMRGVQSLLDLFVATECSVSATAAAVGVSTGAMSRFLLSEDILARTTNELRKARGMRPLR
jgi:hypothetical protein